MKFVKHISAQDSLSEAKMLILYRQSGDLEVLGKLYAAYMPLLYGLCLKYLKNEEKSKDAVMQIFEQLISKLKIHEVSNFKSWLYTLARNYCLMELRVTQKHEIVSFDDFGMENPVLLHQENDFTSENQLNTMSKCLLTLPDEQRLSIDLFYLQQKCYKEVSDITGYDINKVKSYIQNGKRNLKICMEKQKGGDE